LHTGVDGGLSNRVCAPCIELRAARANRVFGTDENCLRTGNTVIDRSKGGVGILSKIADCARIGFMIRAQSAIRADGPPAAQVKI